MDLKGDSTQPTQQECACPADSRIARHFDAKVAERSAKGQDPGLLAVSQRLRDALLSLDPTGVSVLEPGCGRGGLLLELVQAGAAHVTGVDLSPAGIEAARNRFEQAQLADRADLAVGDAARVALEPHDWVILDRVMCCLPGRGAAASEHDARSQADLCLYGPNLTRLARRGRPAGRVVRERLEQPARRAMSWLRPRPRPDRGSSRQRWLPTSSPRPTGTLAHRDLPRRPRQRAKIPPPKWP